LAFLHLEEQPSNPRAELAAGSWQLEAAANWKRYTRGERGIFTRALLRGRQSNLVAQIADKVKLDGDMRRYAMRYIDYFERLLKESQAVDPENLLHSTFMTGDVGKLYLLLCRAVGRDPFGD